VQKGHDPREFSLIAFGGAGPLHAVEVAHILGVKEVIIPEYPGITSAIGLLTTDLKYDAIATQFTLSSAPDLGRLEADAQRLAAQVTSQLRDNGFTEEDIRVERGADCRYVGQGYELRVPLPGGTLDEQAIARVWAEFHELHRSEYGHAFPDQTIELVNLRVAGIGRTPKITPTTLGGERSAERALVKTALVYFEHQGQVQPFPTAFYLRDALPVGHRVDGPAILVQRDTTSVLPPYAHGWLEQNGNFIVRLEA
jgi:N-methylhydantoinase A